MVACRRSHAWAAAGTAGEMLDAGVPEFWMYTAERFLEHARDEQDVEVADETIAAAQELSALIAEAGKLVEDYRFLGDDEGPHANPADYLFTNSQWVVGGIESALTSMFSSVSSAPPAVRELLGRAGFQGTVVATDAEVYQVSPRDSTDTVRFSANLTFRQNLVLAGVVVPRRAQLHVDGRANWNDTRGWAITSISGAALPG